MVEKNQARRIVQVRLLGGTGQARRVGVSAWIVMGRRAWNWMGQSAWGEGTQSGAVGAEGDWCVKGSRYGADRRWVDHVGRGRSGAVIEAGWVVGRGERGVEMIWLVGGERGGQGRYWHVGLLRVGVTRLDQSCQGERLPPPPE